MKNKIASEYEKKVWYRIMKSIYIFLFIIFILFFNMVVIDSFDEFGIGGLIIGNLVIIFGMGIVEGLFWYITTGKWGYPKDKVDFTNKTDKI